MTVELFLTGILYGLTLALVSYAIMIPFRLLNLPDLTAEGAYPLGGAVYASIVLAGISPYLAVFCAALAAGIMGIATSVIHLYLRVNTLLTGIILSTMIYSVNLKVMGKPNIAIFDAMSFLQHSNLILNILVLILTLAIIISSLALFLRTELGLRLRAVGLNQDFSRRHSISVAKYTVLGLFLAGCITGLAGCLIVQLQYYMDVGIGIGIVIHALAALMLGEQIVGNNTLNKQLIAPLIGAIIYQQIQGIALSFGLAPSDLKIVTGSLVLLVSALQKDKRMSLGK